MQDLADSAIGGEPFPVYYKDDIPYLIDESELPVELPEVESYKPSGAAKSPLAGLNDWVNYKDGLGLRETDTMPGYAGSSWYMLRYMDPHNDERFVGEEKENYWRNVDLYIGGAEHAVGHLLYSRMWQKFLFDRGWVHEDEPFKKLVNQGMILGMSAFAIGLTVKQKGMSPVVAGSFAGMRFLVSKLLLERFLFGSIGRQEIAAIEIESQIYSYVNAQLSDVEWRFDNAELNYTLTIGKDEISKKRIPTEFLDSGNRLNLQAFWNWYLPAEPVGGDDGGREAIYFINEDDGSFICHREPEKMSKSKYNVVNPDNVIAEYGADCFRMYEMFLGPVEASKPWDTKGINGVSNFLRKVWRLFYDEKDNWKVTDGNPASEELKILHKTIKKVGEDIEKLAFNTAVSAFMICVNDLTVLKCNKKSILKDLLIILAPFAPFITEELWGKLNENESIHKAPWPEVKEEYLIENNFNYPIQVNGKVRDNIQLPLDMAKEEVEKSVLALESIVKWTEGKTPKKIIVVPGKIVNVVV